MSVFDILIIVIIISLLMGYFFTKFTDNKIYKIENIVNNKTDKDEVKIINNKINKIEDIVNCFDDDLEFRFLLNFNNYYIFRSLINEGIKKYINKNIKKYNLLYLASRGGYEGKYFHEKCDGKNFTVTLVLTEKNKIFGGFTELEWDKSYNFKKGDKGFIFSINNNKIYYNKNKYKIYADDYGPYFGLGGFYIESNKGYDFTNETSNFDVPGKEYILTGEEYFSIKNYAIYQIELE